MRKKCLLLCVGDARTKTSLVGKFWRGIEKHGFEVEQHHPQAADPYNYPHCEIAIMNGLRNHLVVGRDELLKKGKNAIVFDLGYIDRSASGRPNGYYQVGLNRIGWVPDFTCPSDRFDNLGVTVKPLDTRDTDKVLVCGQKFGDPQHGMDEEEHRKFLAKTCREFRDRGFEVEFRHHPRSECHIKGFNTRNEKPLEEILHEYKFIVTYNSTSGVEAILSGTPVIAVGEEVHYEEISSYVNDSGELINPSHEAVLNYLHRLAYAQWKREEIEEGIPFRFLLKVMKGENPFEEDYPYTIFQPKTPTKDPFEGIHEKPWFERCKIAQEVTGERPKNKEHLEILIQNWYNCA